MRRAKEILSLAVITKSKGEIIGEIEDILIDENTGDFKIIVIKNKNKLCTLANNIYKIGEDLVVIKNSKLLFDYNKDNINDLLSVYNKTETLIGEEVITEDGKGVGIVKDIVIDESNYKMAGYEITGGLVNDLIAGRNIVSLNSELKIGEDAIILNKSNLKEI
ncbi:MAG: PRC-barrel domain-containing protein [Bacillota bacterium]